MNPKTREVWALRTNRRAGRYALTQRAPISYGAVALSGSSFEVGGGGLFPGISRGRGPHRLVANSCARTLGHSDFRNG